MEEHLRLRATKARGGNDSGRSVARSFALAFSATLLFDAVPALSQPAATAPQAQQGETLEEVVVTAQKRSENLQSASVAVDALKSEDIAQQGITNAIDLQDVLPAVKFIAADEMTVQIRGLGTVNDNPGVDSAVAYSQDGIFLSHPEALTPVLFDLQRVEAVLGPQGTLYGRNSNGGAINFISNDPAFEFGGHASVGFGNYSAINSDAALNIPVSDVLAFRIAAGTEKHNPYDDDGSNDVDAQAVRIKLLYKPGNYLRILLTVDGAERRSVGANYGAICPPNNIAPGCVGVPYVPYSGLGPPSPSAHNDDTIFGTSLDVQYDLGWGNLISLTGYKHYTFSGDTSPPWYGGVDHFDYIHDERDRSITQELRIASEPASRIAWVAGAYYSNETQPATIQFNYLDTILQGFGLPPGYFQKLTTVSSRYQSEAVFGDITVPLFEGVRFRGGLRYTHENKDSTGVVEAGVLGIPGFPFGPPETNIANETIGRLTWKAGLDYDVTPKNLLYVTVSTGFKSGGVNNLPAAAGLSTYAPETIKAYEAGSKNRFFEDRLQVNAALFYYDYKNYQTFVFYTPTGGPFAGATLFPTVNSQTATFKGGELDAIWKVTQADTLGFDVNWLHDRYDEFVVALPFSPVFDLSGTDVPLTPRSTYGVNYSHVFTIANGDTLSFAANSWLVMSHLVSGNYGSNYTYTQPKYHKTGVNLTYRTASSGWSVTAFVRNIENKATINTISGGYPVLPNLNYTNVMLDPPRTFGLRIGKEF